MQEEIFIENIIAKSAEVTEQQDKPAKKTRMKKSAKSRQVKRQKNPKITLPDFGNNANISESISNEIPEIIPEYIKKTLKYSEDQTDVLYINIKYPQIKEYPQNKNLKSIQKINNFYYSIMKGFIKYAEKVLYVSAANEYLTVQNSKDDNNSHDNTDTQTHSDYYNYNAFKSFGAVTSFEVTYNRNNLLCIYIDANIYSGKGRGNIVRKVNIWDLNNGVVIPSKSLIDCSLPNKKRICTHICNMMEKQMQTGEERYVNTDFKIVFKYFDMQNMFLTDKGYNFFFPQSTISLPECGIVSFLIR